MRCDSWCEERWTQEKAEPKYELMTVLVCSDVFAVGVVAHDDHSVQVHVNEYDMVCRDQLWGMAGAVGFEDSA